jgi:hypothetical protein
MTMGAASKNAMKKILRGEVKQRSRWYFFFHNAILWAVGTISVFAGALIVSLMIFTIVNCDSYIHHEIYGRALSHVTIFLLGIWILLTGGLVILFNLSIRRTKKGYIYSPWIVIVLDLLLSTVFGFIFYFFGMSAYVDDILGDHVHNYYSLEKRRELLFNKPREGLLIGRVSHIDDDNVQIFTSDHNMWVVFTHELPKSIAHQIQKGSSVVFLGTTAGDRVFVACDFRVARVHGMHQNVQKRYEDYIQKIYREQKYILLEQSKKRPQDTLCDQGTVWRIQLQQ